MFRPVRSGIEESNLVQRVFDISGDAISSRRLNNGASIVAGATPMELASGSVEENDEEILLHPAHEAVVHSATPAQVVQHGMSFPEHSSEGK